MSSSEPYHYTQSAVLPGTRATAKLTHRDSFHNSQGVTSVKQLTVRGFDDELSASLRRLAKSEGISLNQAALRLLRKGAGLTDSKGNPNTVGHSLDDFIGVWSREEAESFDTALEVFEIVDESAWT